jgi:hypothetical protein
MDYQEFMPKTKVVLVGETELKVKEFVISKRDAFLKIFLSGIDIVKLVTPFWNTVQSLVQSKDLASGTMSINITELAEPLKDFVIQIFGNDLTKVICLALDTPENRNLIFQDANIKIVNDATHGYDYCPEMFSWIRDSLTIRQEQDVLTAIIETNEFLMLIKNYKTLVSKIWTEARVKTISDQNSNM